MIGKLKSKGWWKYVLSLIIVAKIVFVVFALSALKTDNTDKKEVVADLKYAPVKLPQSVTFAGERMPLELFDVQESLDRELQSNAFFHSQTIRYIKLAPRYFPVIEPILKDRKSVV